MKKKIAKKEPKKAGKRPDREGGVLTKSELKELYLPAKDNFVFVDVPDLQFAMIDGKGNPECDDFQQAIKWLFSAIYPLKRIARQRMGKDFVEPPLECLWWANDMNDFISGNKEKLKWRLMIITADWVSDEMFDQAVATAKQKLGKIPRTLRLKRFHEGRSVQFMHVGHPAKMVPTLHKLYKEFLPHHDLVPNGHHHEIYLNDPNRVAPAKLKTVVRQPVRSR